MLHLTVIQQVADYLSLILMLEPSLIQRLIFITVTVQVLIQVLQQTQLKCKQQ